MKYRELGHTGLKVSEVSFGAWAIGGGWGAVDDEASLGALNAAVDNGVNFIDTADVYGMGRSESLVARLRSLRSEALVVATKAGRKLSPHIASGYNRENLTRFVEESLRNLRVERLDLLQLHCPPTEVYYRPEVFACLESLIRDGKVRACGVSAEKVEEGLKAIEFPVVQTVQIIYNIFRQRPEERFFPEAKRKSVGIIVRVPLASGLLSGKITAQTRFDKDDHRSYNRDGSAFDKGETFSGVDFDRGLQAVRDLAAIVPPGLTLPQMALRWILMQDAVSCVIPGARTAVQARDNAAASELPPLDGVTMQKIRTIYDRHVREDVHQRW